MKEEICVASHREKEEVEVKADIMVIDLVVLTMELVLIREDILEKDTAAEKGDQVVKCIMVHKEMARAMEIHTEDLQVVSITNDEVICTMDHREEVMAGTEVEVGEVVIMIGEICMVGHQEEVEAIMVTQENIREQVMEVITAAKDVQVVK